MPIKQMAFMKLAVRRSAAQSVQLANRGAVTRLPKERTAGCSRCAGRDGCLAGGRWQGLRLLRVGLRGWDGPPGNRLWRRWLMMHDMPLGRTSGVRVIAVAPADAA